MSRVDLPRLLSQLPVRSADAALAAEPPRSDALRRYLLDRFGAPPGTPGSLLAEPVIEGAYPWQPADPDAAASLIGGLDPRLRPLAGRPYAHQLEAWQTLLAPEPRSLVVTAGTGAGKTECFLLPLFQRIATVNPQGAQRGIRAILVYPLNALINSQRERLRQWARPFGGQVRFALYNGATGEAVPARAERHPGELLSRKEIRETPPEILVTNGTMLEYMLVRPQDGPVLSQSQGCLDYVILDEAHSYVGSQAAELALLLRRVCLAFGRQPTDVRFVATSATIATGGDAQAARDGLRQFLAAVSGQPPAQVTLVEGRRAPLDLPPTDPTPPPLDVPTLQAEVSSLGESGEAEPHLWDALAPRAPLQDMARALHAEPVPWSRWRAVAQTLVGGPMTIGAEAALLQLASRAEVGPLRRLLPCRVHLFHTTVAGLWACCNGACASVPAALREGGWRFGPLYEVPRQSCEDCGFPVLEVTFCATCGAEEVEAEEITLGGRAALRRPRRAAERDEFAAAADAGAEAEEGDEGVADEDGGNDEPAGMSVRRVLVSPIGGGRERHYLAGDGRLLDGPQPGALPVTLTTLSGDTPCGVCGRPPRPDAPPDAPRRVLRVGGPYLLGSIVPALLETLPRAAETPRPFDGRKLLMFSDTRQGTARLSAKLQVDAERHVVRAYAYHSVQREPPVDEERVAKLTRRIAALEPLGEDVTDLRAERDRLLGAAGPLLPWEQLRDDLAQSRDLKRLLTSIWEDRFPGIDEGKTADLILYREFARRPQIASQAETLGLIKLKFLRDLPPPPRDWPLSPLDWENWVHLFATHQLRGRDVTSVPQIAQPWLRRAAGATWYQTYLRTDVDSASFDRTRHVAPPYARRHLRGDRAVGRRPRLLTLLAQATGRDPAEPRHADDLNGWIDGAIRALRSVRALRESGGDGEVFEMTAYGLTRVEQAHRCPVTRCILDGTLGGLSPYPARGGVHVAAEPVTFPRHPAPFPTPERWPELDAWLAGPEIDTLRAKGLWSDRTSRIALTPDWFRTAEHSAQQPIERLKQYEEWFAASDINVLSCSTTLEMGVDIGSVEAVAMANAPPSPANYRQRVGRAGRRGQSLALAVTLCKDRPQDRAIFREPLRPLRDPIRPPQVAFGSPVLAQRHINAWALGTWMRQEAERLPERLFTLSVGRFFGLSADTDGRAADDPATRFVRWIEGLEREVAAGTGAGAAAALALATLTRATRLTPEAALLGTTARLFEAIAEGLTNEHAAIRAQFAPLPETDPLRRAESLRLKRLLRVFLFSALADRGFLPGYGFPRRLVPFVTTTAKDLKGALNDEARRTRNGNTAGVGGDFPTRALDVAVTEYAPGAEVVVDGLVHRSEGIAVNWRAPREASDLDAVEALGHVWRCQSCGRVGRGFRSGACDCGGLLQTVELLEPAGFAVDLRRDPHDETERVAYVPPAELWASAAGEAWRDLPDPTSGAIRATQSGSVAIVGRGPGNEGYAICLACGRAAAESDGGEAALLDHKPLRGGGLCRGGAGETQRFSLRRHVALGRVYATDLFELHLTGCKERGVALALAVALRAALARSLGIETDELQVAAGRSRLPSGSEAWSALLFDTADGGAGFASAAATGEGRHDFVHLLHDARARLDCPSDCDTVCPDCLLDRSTQRHADALDRQGALALLDEHLPRLRLDPALAVFGPESRLEYRALTDALAADLAAHPADRLTLAMPGGPEAWEIERWPAAILARQAGDRGQAATLLFAASTLAGLGADDRARLGRTVLRLGATMATVPDLPRAGGLVLAAWVGEPSRAWAVSPDGASPGPDWGGGTVVRGPWRPVIAATTVDPAALLAPSPGATLIDIRTELDGPLGGLPGRIRDLIARHWPDLPQAAPAEITYEDRYLRSPLTLRLAGDLALAFHPDGATQVVLATTGPDPRRAGRPSTMFDDDWQSARDVSAAAEAWLRHARHDTWSVRLDQRLGHARRLTVTWQDETRLTLFLDQGMGFLSLSGSAPFPFDRAANAQGLRLAQYADLRLRAERPNPGGPATHWVLRVG